MGTTSIAARECNSPYRFPMMGFQQGIDSHDGCTGTQRSIAEDGMAIDASISPITLLSFRSVLLYF